MVVEPSGDVSSFRLRLLTPLGITIFHMRGLFRCLNQTPLLGRMFRAGTGHMMTYFDVFSHEPPSSVLGWLTLNAVVATGTKPANGILVKTNMTRLN